MRFWERQKRISELTNPSGTVSPAENSFSKRIRRSGRIMDEPSAAELAFGRDKSKVRSGAALHAVQPSPSQYLPFLHLKNLKKACTVARKQLGVGSCPIDPCLHMHVHGSPLYGQGPAWVWPGCIRLGLHLTNHMLACRAACFKHSHGRLQFMTSCVCKQQDLLGPNLLLFGSVQISKEL